jgi:DNA-binding transcriptional ArsR family regulator
VAPDESGGSKRGKPKRKRRATKKSRGPKADALRKRLSHRRKKANGRPRSAVLVALSHPMRRRILRNLLDRSKPRSPLEMALELEGPLGRIAYHIKVLRRLGAVELIDEQQVGGAAEPLYETTIEDDLPVEMLLEETREEDEEHE